MTLPEGQGRRQTGPTDSTQGLCPLDLGNLEVSTKGGPTGSLTFWTLPLHRPLSGSGEASQKRPYAFFL